jgi:hypothetical protein
MCPSGDRKTFVAFSLGYRRGDGGQEGQPLMTAWDAATRRQVFRRTIGGIHLGTPVISKDLRSLATSQGTDDRPGGQPVRIEALARGEPRRGLPRAKGQTYPLAFSPDGTLLVTLCYDAGDLDRPFSLKVWEVATAGEVLSLPAVMNAGVAFSADGRLLAASAPARGIVLWDLRRGEELQRLEGFNADVLSLAFSPDGRRLVSGHTDSTLLVWEVRNSKPVNARLLDAERLAQEWADLVGDPKKAFAARGVLAGSPAESVDFLKNRLAPVRPADAAQLERLLADLDDDSSAAPEKARRGLEALGERAAGALRAALGGKPSPEARKRIQALLRTIDGPVQDRETLRAMRAVAVLEDVGTREARAVLTTLAGGVAEARLTREARAALGRLGVPAMSGR